MSTTKVPSYASIFMWLCCLNVGVVTAVLMLGGFPAWNLLLASVFGVLALTAYKRGWS